MNATNRKVLASVLGAVALILLVRWMFWGASWSSLVDADEPAKRLSAIEDLRTASGSGARAALVRLADDKDPRVAVEAVKALGLEQHQHRVSYEALKTVLASAADNRVRAAAATSLGRYTQTDPVMLTSLLRDEPDAKVRAGAAKGLAYKKSKQAIAPLFAALRDPDPEVRAWAITAITKVTFARFNYNARKPPEAQTEALLFIEAYLKRNGLM